MENNLTVQLEQSQVSQNWQNKAAQELSKIVELFQSHNLEAFVTKAIIDAPTKPSSKWSLGNQLLMLLEKTEDARGFRQWQEVSRYVKKGSKAFYILGPLIVKVKDKDDPNLESEKLVGFRTIPVFRIEDTDGLPLEPYKPRTIPPLMNVAEKFGLKVKYDNLSSGYGSFDPERKEITLATEDAGTFFHELSHAAQLRIDGSLKGGQDVEQEAIAQLSSCVLMRVFGFDQDVYTWNYLASYAREHSPKAVGSLCLRVLGKVQKILNLILEEEEA